MDAELNIHHSNLSLACLHVPVWEYKKEDSDFKDYIEGLIGEERIYPYSGGTKLTNFHDIIVNPPLKV